MKLPVICVRNINLSDLAFITQVPTSNSHITLLLDLFFKMYKRHQRALGTTSSGHHMVLDTIRHHVSLLGTQQWVSPGPTRW